MNNHIEPVVSVVMITYNHEAYIAEAITGVLMQECNFDIELIIADDNSPDNTQNIVQSFKDHKYFGRIKYIKHIQNKGMMENFVWALNQTKGNYVALCEGDDYWTDPYKLQKQVDFLERNKSCVLCFHRSYKVYEGSIDLQKVNFNFQDRYNTKDILSANWIIYTATILFKNQFVYPKWFLIVKHGDYALQLFLSTLGELGFIDSYMSVYRKHSLGVSNSFGNKINITLTETLLAFEKNNPKFRKIVRKKRSQLMANHGFLQKGIPRFKFFIDSVMLNNLIIFHILFRYCVLVKRRLFTLFP